MKRKKEESRMAPQFQAAGYGGTRADVGAGRGTQLRSQDDGPFRRSSSAGRPTTGELGPGGGQRLVVSSTKTEVTAGDEATQPVKAG